MKISKTLVAVGASALLLSTLVPAVMALNGDSSETEIVKPSRASIESFNHVDKLRSFESPNSLSRTSEEEVIKTLRQQTSYLKSLKANDLIETLGELALYDETNFEKYAESVLPILYEKWGREIPLEVTNIFADQTYPQKMRAFFLDIAANSGQQLSGSNIEQIKTVVEDKSEDMVLRRYALLQLKTENVQEKSTFNKQSSIDLNGIFEDSSEPVEVRSAAVTAMRRLGDPNFSNALATMAKTENMNDPLLRSFLTSAAHAKELDTYFDVVKQVVAQTEDQEIFESAIYSLGVSGGEDAVRVVMQMKDKFGGTAKDIIRFALLSNAKQVSALLDSPSDEDKIMAIKASEIMHYGEVYGKIKEVHANSQNSEVILAAEQALENIDPNDLIDPNKNGKWGGQ
ncbi:hypothetical protein QUF95_25915 [Paenibacillus silvae]|uniref:hypothetical protein n=1 Tax=Paenibacillus silvae TaxID=1325358 RepID=UPI0025A1F521|nr:hypothetical protein [Paenibacillus silvae]MDM5280792.1 hypothetical protein [Paenibacillus silvae]